MYNLKQYYDSFQAHSPLITCNPAKDLYLLSINCDQSNFYSICFSSQKSADENGETPEKEGEKKSEETKKEETKEEQPMEEEKKDTKPKVVTKKENITVEVEVQDLKDFSKESKKASRNK